MTSTDCNTPSIALLLATLLASTAPVFAQSAPADQPLATAQGPGANGQSGGQEIIVTATKRPTLIQNVPFSVNAQTQADIQRTGSTNLEEVSRNVASLNIQNLGPGQSQLSIRGVSSGQIVRDQPGVKEQVGVYLDESVISLSLFTPDLDLFDLNRVETLRGPQGTLFGSGSMGGTIRYITNQPRTDKIEGTVEGDINVLKGGDVGGWGKAAINLPVNDKIAVRAVGYYTRYGGFIDALTPGNVVKKNINDGKRYGGRIAVLLQPTDEISITPRIVYQKIETNGFNREDKYNIYANPFGTTPVSAPVTLRDREQFLLQGEKFKDETTIADINLTITHGPIAMTAVSSYTHRNILVSRDASALTGSVSIDLGFPVAGVLLPSRLNDTTKVDSFTQEIRFASTGTGPFQWVVGGFYSDTDRTYQQLLPTPGYAAFTDARLGAGTSVAVANGFPLDSPYNAYLPYNIEQSAVFGEATYDITRQLSVTAGGRYYGFQERRTFKSGGLFSNDDNKTDRTKSDGFNPRFLVKYEVTDGVTVNAQAAKGFRLGGVNDPLNIPLCGPTDAATYGGFPRFNDESEWNYEGGVKAHVGPFRVNAAGFYTDIKNLQVTADAGTCSSRVIFNVPKAHSAGGEFEISVQPLKGLDLSVSGDAIESRFDSTLLTAGGAVIAGIRKGNRLPSTPEFQIAATGTYRFPLTDRVAGRLTATVQHIGSRYTQPGDQEGNPHSFKGYALGTATAGTTVLDLKLPAYEMVNLQAGADLGSGLDVTVYVNNLLDKNALLSFDRERGGRARSGFAVSTPRQIGVTFRKAF